MGFTIAQISIAVIVIILIILQERSGAMSGLMGGGESSSYQTRRGLERGIFYLTIAFVVAFAALALAQLIY